MRAGELKTMSDFKPAPVKSAVTIAAVEALDIRLGEIIAVDNVPNSSKLVRLTVSFGDHTRSILAGLRRERENPGALVGRQTVFVINLEPKRLAGEVSEGMLLDLGFADGLNPAMLLPERSMPNGTRAG
jgi:tRNA-binding protein